MTDNSTLKRLEDRYSAIREEQNRLWRDRSRYGEYGDLELTPAGKRRMAELVREMREVDQSLDAAYRMPC